MGQGRQAAAMRERCTRRVVLASSEMSRLWRPAAVGVFAVAASCFVAGAASVGAIAQVQSPAGFQAPRDAIQPLTGPARVKGRVIFADTGAPVRDFMVTLTAANSGFALTATTDDDGAFDFRDVPLSTFALRLRKTGYVPVSTSIPLQWLKDRVNVDLGVLRLTRGGVIAGRVVDMFGEPVADMPVQAWSETFPNPGDRRVGSLPPVQTNDLGEYRLFGLMPGTYFVSTGFGRGFASTFYGGATVAADAQAVMVQSGEQVIGIDMPARRAPLAQLSGTVMDANGHAGPDAFVILSTGRLEGASVFTTLRVETDEEGRFRFRDLVPGDYQIDVVGLASMAAISTAGTAAPAPGRLVPEFASASVSVSDQSGEVSIRTTRGSVVRGIVTVDGQRPSSAAVAGLKVTTVPPLLVGSKAEVDVVRDEDVSGDGTFTMTGVTGARRIGISGSRGLALLRVTLNGADVTDVGVAFGEGPIDGLDIALTSKPAMVKGHVVDSNGSLVAGNVVVFAGDERLRNRLRSRHVAYAAAESAGGFTIDSLPPGQYLAVAIDHLDRNQRGNPGFFEWLKPQAVPFTLADGETKTLTLVRR